MTFIILDRDGVVNFDSPHYIKSADEWIPIPGSLEAIKRLNDAGVIVAMATNQAGPAQGKFPREQVGLTFEKMHAKLAELSAHIDYVAMCLHHPNEGCECRKPKPGMLLEISDKLSLPLSEAVFVGDSFKDIEAARAVSAKPVLVKTGKGEGTFQSHPELTDEIDVYDDLMSFVSEFLS